MVVRVEYYIDKLFFVENIKKIRKSLCKQAFEISVMKFDKMMSDKEIAKSKDISVLNVRKILSYSCENIRNKKFKIK